MDTFEQKIMDSKSESIIENNIVIGKQLDVDENCNFNTMIIDSFNKYPDFVGMINAETGEKTTFAEMKDRSVRCALWLRKQGFNENDVIGFSTPLQMNDYVPYLATLYNNSIIYSWNYNEFPEKVQHLVETGRPKVIFACKQSIDNIVEIVKKVGIDCKFVAFEKHHEHVSLEEIMAEQSQQEVDIFECIVPLNPRKKVSKIIFSSGTTSTPKAILLSYHTLLARHVEESGLHTGMTSLWYTTFPWIVCGTLLLATIRLRCTRVVPIKAFDLETNAKFIEKYNINFIFVRPYLLTQCDQSKIFQRYNFKHLELVVFAGTKINKSVLEECQKSLPHTSFVAIYGTVEAGGVISRHTKNLKCLDSAGYVCSGVKLKIIDSSTKNVLGPNKLGELYYKTDIAMLGYLNNPDETKKILDEEGWLQSGDLGYYDEDGEIFISDRLKSLIKTKTYTISPSDFEEILIQHPDVDDCAVVGVEHLVDIERPFVFIIKACNAKVSAEELIEFAAKKNEHYRLIAGLTFLDQLPYTQTGKKHLIKLQEMAKNYVKEELERNLYN